MPCFPAPGVLVVLATTCCSLGSQGSAVVTRRLPHPLHAGGCSHHSCFCSWRTALAKAKLFDFLVFLGIVCSGWRQNKESCYPYKLWGLNEASAYCWSPLRQRICSTLVSFPTPPAHLAAQPKADTVLTSWVQHGSLGRALKAGEITTG